MKKNKVDKKVDYAMQELTQTQFEIMHGLANGMNISEIARHRKTSRQAVYKVIPKLLEKGLIEKIGYAYGLTEKGKKGLHSFMGFTHKLRQHNVAFKLEILDSPRNWDKKRNQLTTLPYFNKKVKLKNNEYELFNFGKVQVKTTTKSAIIKIPTLYDKTVEGAMVQAMDILYGTIPKIEAQFKVKLTKDRKANITIISQEYARLGDALAKMYRNEDKKLYITGDDGKIWLIADYSFQVDELETIHTSKAGEDMGTVHNFMNDLRKNPTTFGEVREDMRGLTSNVNSLTLNINKAIESEVMYGEHHRSHVKAIQTLGKQMGEFTSTMKVLIEAVEKLNKK